MLGFDPLSRNSRGFLEVSVQLDLHAAVNIS